MRQVLERDWTLTFTHPESGETMTIPAQVPGNVIADLHRAGVVPDPYFGLNSAGLRIWEFVDFEYRTGFRSRANGSNLCSKAPTRSARYG